MHIPDGSLPLLQALAYWAVALLFTTLSLRWARRDMDEERIPLVAVLAAGIFTIQLLNVPVGLGTTGHVVGGALAAIVLGSPYAAVFILTLVLLVQGFLFGDGGITTMGANILNMGIIGGFTGFYAFRALVALFGKRDAALFSAGWLACLVPALAAAGELSVAGYLPSGVAFAGMGIYHALIGLIEGGVTMVAVHLIASARPDIIDAWARGREVAG